jgi:hypothetical protein
VARLRLSQNATIVSPVHGKLDAAAGAVLDRAVAVLFRPNLSPSDLQTFLGLDAPSVLDNANAANAYLGEAAPFFNSDLANEGEFQALDAISRAEIFQMIRTRLKAAFDSGQTADQILAAANMLRQNLTASQLSIGNNVKSLDALRRGIHRIRSQETLLSDMLVAQQKQFVHEVNNFTEQVRSAAEAVRTAAARLGPQVVRSNVPNSQIGVYVDSYSSAMNQLQLGAHVLTLLSSGQLPTEQLVGYMEGFSGQLPQAVQDLARPLSDLLEHQSQIADAVGALFGDGGSILQSFSDSLGTLFPDISFSSSASSITEIAGSLLGGNYLSVAGAIPGLGSILGGLGFGGQSQAILNKLAEMDHKLDTILATQERILNEINQVNQNVLYLTRLVEQEHQETMAMLENMEKDLLINREIELELLQGPLRSCYLLIPPVPGAAGYTFEIANPESRDYQRLVWASFPNYQRQSSFLVSNLGSFVECDRFLRTTFSNTNTTVFSLLRFDTNSPRSSRFSELSTYLNGFALAPAKELNARFPDAAGLGNLRTAHAKPFYRGFGSQKRGPFRRARWIAPSARREPLRPGSQVVPEDGHFGGTSRFGARDFAALDDDRCLPRDDRGRGGEPGQ